MYNKTSLSGKLNGFNLETTFVDAQEYHWPTVANTTLASMTKSFYANAPLENYTRIIALETSFNKQFLGNNNSEVINRSIVFAKNLSDEILLWSSTDGGFGAQFNNFPSDYQPLDGVQYWKPTAPNRKALQPY